MSSSMLIFSYCHNIIINLIANCGHPVFSSSTLTVREMSTEGSILNFTCPPGLVLTGPNTTTCMENGEWEPDSRQAKCIGKVNKTLLECNLFNNILVVTNAIFLE